MVEQEVRSMTTLGKAIMDGDEKLTVCIMDPEIQEVTLKACQLLCWAQGLCDSFISCSATASARTPPMLYSTGFREGQL